MSDTVSTARSTAARLAALALDRPAARGASRRRSGGSSPTDPLRSFDNGAPPVETLTFERTILDDDGIHLLVRAGGSEPMTIAQVQVDDAYWLFTQDPPGAIARGATAWINVPYPWVLGDAHMVIVAHQHRHGVRARDRGRGADAAADGEPALAAGDRGR